MGEWLVASWDWIGWIDWLVGGLVDCFTEWLPKGLIYCIIDWRYRIDGLFDWNGVLTDLIDLIVLMDLIG